MAGISETKKSTSTLKGIEVDHVCCFERKIESNASILSPSTISTADIPAAYYPASWAFFFTFLCQYDRVKLYVLPNFSHIK